MKNIIALLTLCFLAGCIKPFDQEVDEGAKKLVVNGLITNEPGPYTVKINKTTSYGGHFTDVDRSVVGALVSVSDELGNTEQLKEKREGEFVTSATGMRGRVGGTYTLKIVLKDGTTYTSEPETLLPVAPIDKLYFRVNETKTVDKDNNEQLSHAIELLVDLKDPAAEKNFYRWTSVGTYELETQPENHVTYDKNGNEVPAPKACCRQCWAVRTDYSAKVRSDQQINGNSLIGQPVGAIPVTPQYLDIKYHVNLSQMSLSEKAYNFWRMLETQISGTGSVQDPAPANAVGNVYNVTNPEEEVLGYFGASEVVRKTMFIQKTDLPFILPDFIYADDCQTIPSATTNRPGFW